MSATEVRGSQPFALAIRMAPEWRFIDEVSRFVESFCAASSPGTDRHWQVALATHELMQNAISYASTPFVELGLEVDPSRSSVRVSVSHGCRPEQAEKLRERLARLYAHADALAAYVAIMGEDPGGRGGLGLARIRFEAELDLELVVEGDRLTVHASGPLEAVETQRRLASWRAPLRA
jgi:anti-sigma regulatory factor (Ser/Thr protein kinase)